MKLPHVSRVRTPLGVCLLVLASAVSLFADGSQSNEPRRFSHRARGQEALTMAEPQLPEISRLNGLSEAALRKVLRQNHDLWLDLQGKLLYACEGLALAPGSAEAAQAAASAEVLSTAIVPNSTDAFKLHSLPGATRVIYLDFNGHTTSGTAWNSSTTGGADIVSAPFDLDGDPTTFSTAERDRITRIWQRVSEDYMPFAIDVTTEDPGLEALRKTNSTDQNYGVRVVISPTSAWNPGAGGIAYVGSFNWNSDTPCFVFSSNLGPNSEKAIAEASSHEAGHTLGLHHNGKTDGTAYYGGQGNWAPIMGVSYYKPITQWSRGEYTGANNTEDQLTVMQNFGAPLIADDHGNTPATATLVKGSSVAVVGVIGTRTDVDVFRFDVGAGTLALTIAGTSPEPDLDIKADLLDSAGNIVVSNDPTGLASSINATVAAGTYYLRIDGVGAGDPVTTGYSDYASLGEYLIKGTVPAGSTTPNQPPVAAATGTPTSGTAPLTVTFSSANSSDSDGTIASRSWNFGDGTTSTDANPSHVYTAAGNYSAVLTVTDNTGASATSSVAIVVSPSSTPNQSPVAKATATPTSGTAPLTVAFSSLGSSDSDGTIVSTSWNFGDGSASSAANPSHVYTAAGTYSATLTVTDNAGATGTSTVSIVVSAPTSASLDVNAFTLATNRNTSGSNVTATVRVLNQANQPVAGAALTLRWSGVFSGTLNRTTDANGQIQFTTQRTTFAGTQTVTITTVTPPSGYTYNPNLFPASLTQTIGINQ